MAAVNYDYIVLTALSANGFCVLLGIRDQPIFHVSRQFLFYPTVPIFVVLDRHNACLLRLLQYNVEKPDPYSNTDLSLKSNWFKYSIAG